MASLTTVARHFEAGNGPYTGAVMGTTATGQYNETVVLRYQFHTPATGASSISFQTSNATAIIRGSSSSDDSIGRMRFAVGSNATEHKSRKSSSVGYAVTQYSYGNYIKGSLSIKLLPDTDYYLWIFPAENFSAKTQFSLGSCTVTTSGTYGTPSTITASNGTFGNSIPITLTRSYSGVTHTVTVACGGITKTLSTKSSSTNFTWTPSLSEYGAAITNSKTAQATITCTTYYGSTSWGTTTKTITMSFPNSAAPTIDSVTLSVNNTGSAAAALSCYVQGYSKVSASITASAKYSASVSSYAVTVNGTKTSGSGSTVNSVVITGSGTVTVTLTVTDSRGFTASTTQDITVEAYSNPQLFSVNVYRSDSNGVADESGVYLSAQVTGSISSCNGENSISALIVECNKAADNTSMFSPDTFAALTNNPQVPDIFPGLDANYTWIATVTITDALGNSTSAKQTISSQKWAMKFNSVATAVGFGKAPEADKVLEIPSDWEIVRGTVPNEEHAAFVPPNEEMALKSDVVLKTDVPSMFSGMLSVSTVDSAALNISAGGTDAITASAAKTGYTPIGVVGWSLPGSGSSYAAVFRCYLSGTTLNASIRSVNAAITSQFRWYVLYRKNTY